MAMEMAMDQWTAMDDNGGGWQQWTETEIDSNGNCDGPEDSKNGQQWRWTMTMDGDSD